MLKRVSFWAASLLGIASLLAPAGLAHADLSMGATTLTATANLTVDGVAASVYSLGPSTTTGTITIGGSAQTGETTIRSVNVTGTTTDAGIVLQDTALTTGTGLYVLGSGATMQAGGVVQNLDMGAATVGNGLTMSTTGVYTGTGVLSVTADSATTGTIGVITANGLTTGTGLRVTSSGTITTTGEVLDVVASGATTSTGAARITAAALTTGSALAVIGSAPATMTVAGSHIRVNDGTTDVFRVGWNGHITNAQTTAPVVTGGTCTAESFATTAGSDTAGEVTATCNNQTLVIAFNTAYAAAPVCVVSAQNAAAAAGAREAYTTSTANLTITVPGNITAGIWAYHCIE